MTLVSPTPTATSEAPVEPSFVEPVSPPPPAAAPDTPPLAARAEHGHWVLATLLAGAGAIHLTMVPVHWAESASLGVAFLACGLVQLGLALAVAARPARPARWALWATIAVSLASVAAWAVSRTSGLPIGPGDVEDVALIDAATVALEVTATLLAGGLLLARRSGALCRSGALAVAGGFGVLALTGAALASPSARAHVGGHAHDEAAAGSHSHGTEDDLGFSQLANGQMGSHEHPGQGAAPSTTAGIGPRQAGRLAEQLALTAPIATAYPTLGDARDAGFVQEGPFSPGLGLHVSGPNPTSFNVDGDMDPEDIAAPTLIYDGLEDDSRLAGFMYMAYQDTEPAGFAGPLDRWHYHTAVCMVFGPNGVETPFGADLTGVTEEMCTAAGGQLVDFTGYMVHAWTVPGYESSLGTFSDLNPAITCPDGTYYTIPIAEIGDAQTTCRGEQGA